MAEYHPINNPPEVKNVLVLGYGLSAIVFHIPFIKTTPGLRLHSILQRPRTPASGSEPITVSAKHHYANTSVRVFSAWGEVEKYQRETGSGDKIDVLVITAGNQAHVELVRKGLRLNGEGVHVIVEKPFTVKSEDGVELIELAREVGKVLTVYHSKLTCTQPEKTLSIIDTTSSTNSTPGRGIDFCLLLIPRTDRRFDSDFLTLTRLLAPSRTAPPTLRNLTHLHSSFNRYVPPTVILPPWRRATVLGNGVLFDLGSHLIDQILHLFRTTLSHLIPQARSGLPTRLCATLRSEGSGPTSHSHDPSQWGVTWVDDGFDISLEYTLLRLQQGVQTVTVHLSASSVSPRFPQERFVVRTNTGVGYVKFGSDVQEGQLIRQTSAPEDAEFGVEPRAEWGVLHQLVGAGKIGEQQWITSEVKPETGDYGLFYRNFVSAVRNEEEITVPPEQAVDVLRVIEAAVRSWKEQKWVEIDA